MPIVLDQFYTGSAIQLDQFDESIIPTYNVTERAAVAFSASDAGFEFDVVYEIGLGANVDIYTVDQVEFVDPPSAPVYQVSDATRVTMLFGDSVEYVAFDAVFEVTDGASVSLGADALFEYLPNEPGDYFVAERAAVSFTFSDQMSFTASEEVYSVDGSYDALAAWLSPTPSELPLDFGSIPSPVERVEFVVNSVDPNWQGNSGPFGGTIAVALELVDGEGNITPLSSLSVNQPRATFLNIDGANDTFLALRAALAAGDARLRIGGYEAFPDRSFPVGFSGTTTVRAEALA